MIPAPKLSRLGRAAMIYATQLGWRVFPLHSVADGVCSCGDAKCTGTKPGKHPRTPRGCLDATTDAAQVRIWWSQWPDAHIGVATGAGLVVIDIDPRHGGDDGFDDLRGRLGALPDTVEAITGSGGRHIYLALPEGVTVRNSASTLAPGVDVRGDGGYVVAPPSGHVCGKAYGWELSSRPDEVDVAPIPQAWLDAMTKRPKLRVLPGGSGGDIVEGSRNETLFKRACSMRSAGFEEPAILAAILAENDTRCSPPLDPAEVKSIVSSAARYQPGLSPDYAAKRDEAAAKRAPATKAEAPVEADADGVISSVNDEDWLTKLSTTKQGAVRNTFANLCAILRHEEPYATLKLNAMTRSPELNAERVNDAGLSAIREKIELRWQFSPGADAVASAVLLVASEKPHHPVRDYLRGLTWDRVDRLEHVAVQCLGAEDTPLNRTLIGTWAVSAVARAMEPGCKVDTSLVLVGPQGIGKSSFFRILGGQWFSDSAVDIESKDAMMQINAAWIYELGELEHVTSRAHAGRVKAFVSSQVDTYRAPYGRVVESVPRHNVIVGSTNEAQFLSDSTGDRRFWVMRVSHVDTATLKSDRDQLWAEAVARYDAGEAWWLSAEAEEARVDATEVHRITDAWEESVALWLASLAPHEVRAITSQRILVGALHVDLDRITDRETRRVAAIMRRLGWTNRVLRVDGRNARVWDVQNTDGSWRNRP